MGQAALVLDGVTKRYPDFTLDRVSFQVPRGSIVGLIGENGAGKSTTIHAILGLVRTDGGTVALLGEGELDAARRDQIGVVFDGSNYPELLTPRQLGRVFARLYPSWDGEIYRRLLDRFQLPAGKKLKQFSKGMKRKYAIAVAMSHRAQPGPHRAGGNSGSVSRFHAGGGARHPGLLPHHQRFGKGGRLHRLPARGESHLLQAQG